MGVRRIALDPTETRPGSTLKPIARFVADDRGHEVAAVTLGEAEVFERQPKDLALARLNWIAGHEDGARAVIDAAVKAAETEYPSRSVHHTVSASVYDDCPVRVALMESSGFRLLQEKEGFIWRDTGRVLPDSTVTVQSMSRLGREPFRAVMMRCQRETRDRVDSAMIARRGLDAWTADFLDHHATADDADSWLLASIADDVVGYVGLGRRGADDTAGIIVLIGVVPEHRGRSIGRQLVYTTYGAARRRGMTSVAALVDVENGPMMSTILRTGARADAEPWHQWLYAKLVA